MINISYSYTDLDPIIKKTQKDSENLSQKAYSLNTGRKALPHMPKERRETLPELADWWNIPAKRQVKKTINEIENGIDEHQKLMQQYREETDRRNAILNRMEYLKWIMKGWYQDNAKNKLAWLNTVIKSLDEYGKLKQEADKFIKYIKKPI